MVIRLRTVIGRIGKTDNGSILTSLGAAYRLGSRELSVLSSYFVISTLGESFFLPHPVGPLNFMSMQKMTHMPIIHIQYSFRKSIVRSSRERSSVMVS